MAEYRFCPNCGHPLPRPGSQTTKIDLEKLAELRAKATPSLPPPPALPTIPAEECPRCSSRPPPRAPLRIHPIPAVVALLAIAAALAAYLLSR